MTLIVLTGQLTQADHKGHIPLHFTAPAGTTGLRVFFSYHPQRARDALFDNMICLSLFGPNGPRGTRHNNPQRALSISADRATPGYTPGPIEPGEWTITLDAFRILPPDPIHYRLEIALSSDPVRPVATGEKPALADLGPGWYRGDLHAHTLHSDGKWDIPDLVAAARLSGLDFVTLTDHNTVSGLAEMDALADSGLLTMGGVELTTHYGHALALGVRDWQEWRANSLPGVTMPGVANAVMQAGGLFVIAHPLAPGDPVCTGCRWEYADMRPGNAPAVEIWNGVWSDYNEEGLLAFRQWLNESWIHAGRKLVATAGTDTHGPFDERGRRGFNHVFAEGRTERDILAAVARGRNYLSCGPRLILEGRDSADAIVAMGDHATDLQTLKVDWSGCSPATELHLIRNGEIIAKRDVPNAGHFELAARVGERAWHMAELRDQAGELHAVTNPVFAGRPL